MSAKYNPDIKALAKKVDKIVEYVGNTPGIHPKVETGFYTHFGFVSIVHENHMTEMNVLEIGEDVKDRRDSAWCRDYRETAEPNEVLWVPCSDPKRDPISTIGALIFEQGWILGDEVELEEEAK